MRHQTPLDALQTLDRELASVCEDVTRPGSMLGNRIDSILELLPLVVAAMQEPAYAAQRSEGVRALESLHARHGQLTAALTEELSRVQEEISQLATGARATRSYGSATSAPSRLDHIG